MAENELGKQTYQLCAACHGADGQGVPNVGPPLADNQWVNGPVDNLIKIQLRGIQGPITIKPDVVWSEAPMMVPNAYLSDDQIAAALTYIRSSWGNKVDAVTADQVKALRGEQGKPMLTEAELEPLPVVEEVKLDGTPIAPTPPPSDPPPSPDSITGLSTPMLLILAVFFGIIGLTLAKDFFTREA